MTCDAKIAQLQGLVDQYAQRVMDQDTEIAILRQRDDDIGTPPAPVDKFREAIRMIRFWVDEAERRSLL